MGLRLAIGLASLACIGVAQQGSDFAGTWVLRAEGQAVLKLTLTAPNGVIGGALTKPARMTIDQDGEVTGIGPEQVDQPVEKAALDGGRLSLTIDGDPFVMTLDGRDRARITPFGMRTFVLERAQEGQPVVLATRMPEPQFPPEIRALREQLRRMVAEEQEARLAYDQPRWEALDAKNRPEVLRIFDRYGWVTRSLAGRDAAHDFWLLAQHQTLEIQQRLLPSLEKAAKGGDASMSDYAYLYDRVQMGLGKPQRWGTQVKCEQGKPALYVVEDPAGLDGRREELHMPPVAAYLAADYLVKFCAGK